MHNNLIIALGYLVNPKVMTVQEPSSLSFVYINTMSDLECNITNNVGNNWITFIFKRNNWINANNN